MKPILGKPIIDLLNVQQVFMYNCNLTKETDVFLSVRGDKTKGITLKNNNLSYALKPLVKEDAVAERIVVD